MSTTSGRVRRGIGTVDGLPDDGEVGLGVEQRAEPGAHDRLVIGDQDRDGAHACAADA